MTANTGPRTDDLERFNAQTKKHAAHVSTIISDAHLDVLMEPLDAGVLWAPGSRQIFVQNLKTLLRDAATGGYMYGYRQAIENRTVPGLEDLTFKDDIA